MRAFLVAATGLPTILPTAALVAVVCFWLPTLAHLNEPSGPQQDRAT
ncbi:hypothetical protein [Streptomyces sp. NPDC047061]